MGCVGSLSPSCAQRASYPATPSSCCIRTYFMEEKSAKRPLFSGVPSQHVVPPRNAVQINHNSISPPLMKLCRVCLRVHQLIDICSFNARVALLLLLQKDSKNLDRWCKTKLVRSNPALHACNTNTWLDTCQRNRNLQSTKPLTPYCELISNSLKIFSAISRASWWTLGAVLAFSHSRQYFLICASVTWFARSSSALFRLLISTFAC